MKDDTDSTIKPLFGLRHPASGLLHLLGALFAMTGTAWTLMGFLDRHSFWHIASISIFGGSMTLLYLASASYHLLSLSEKGTRILRQLDHSMIYVFIAGSYTPFCLLLFRSGNGWSYLTGVWVLALAGVGSKVFWPGSSRRFRVFLYLLMGWICVFMIPQLWAALPAGGFAWLVAGGAAYTIGAAVYALKFPNPSPEYFGYHELWHLFVVVGSGCHLWVVSQYL
jgi:hemolysin III